MAFGLCVTAAGTFLNQNRDKVSPVNSTDASYHLLWEDLCSESEAELMEYFVLELLLVSSWLPGIKAMNVPLLSSCPPQEPSPKTRKKFGCFSSSAPNLVLGYLNLFIFPVPVQVTAHPVYSCGLFLIICGVTDGQTAGRGYKKEAEEAGYGASRSLNPREDHKTRQNLAA